MFELCWWGRKWWMWFSSWPFKVKIRLLGCKSSYFGSENNLGWKKPPSCAWSPPCPQSSECPLQELLGHFQGWGSNPWAPFPWGNSSPSAQWTATSAKKIQIWACGWPSWFWWFSTILVPGIAEILILLFSLVLLITWRLLCSPRRFFFLNILFLHVSLHNSKKRDDAEKLLLFGKFWEQMRPRSCDPCTAQRSEVIRGLWIISLLFTKLELNLPGCLRAGTVENKTPNIRSVCSGEPLLGEPGK